MSIVAEACKNTQLVNALGFLLSICATIAVVSMVLYSYLHVVDWLNLYKENRRLRTLLDAKDQHIKDLKNNEAHKRL